MFCFQSEDPDMDWEFPEDQDNFVGSLSSFNMLVFSNSCPDVRVIPVPTSSELLGCINNLFPDNSTLTQMVVPNPEKGTSCTHFMVMADRCNIKSPTNFRLETFLKGVGIHNLQARCLDAVVVGMCGNIGDNYVNVPHKYLLMYPDGVDPLGPRTVVSSDVTRICGIEGMSVPRYLPNEIQWHILKYLKHPCADIISSEMKRVNEYWDCHFGCLFTVWGSDQMW